MTVIRATFVLAVAAMLLAGREACACGKDKAKDVRNVKVSVVAILASEKDGKVDPKLKAIAREIRKIRPALKGFRMANLSSRSLRIGAADKFELVEGEFASVTIKGAADKMDRVKLKIVPPLMGSICYSTPCGKFLPILTPFRTKMGEYLLIAIRVQPCGGK